MCGFDKERDIYVADDEDELVEWLWANVLENDSAEDLQESWMGYWNSKTEFNEMLFWGLPEEGLEEKFAFIPTEFGLAVFEYAF